MAHLYGPAARCKPKMMIWRSWSCASVSGPIDGAFGSWPSWISARARSHSRVGPEGQKGHLITNALARPFSISSFRLADLGGKANHCFRDQPEPSAVPFVNLSVIIQAAALVIRRTSSEHATPDRQSVRTCGPRGQGPQRHRRTGPHMTPRWLGLGRVGQKSPSAPCP